MNRRQFTKRSALTLAVAGLGGSAFQCGPSKTKAVKYAGLIIDLSKEAVPLLNLLGAPTIAEVVSSRVIPALEKLKEALANTDIPTSQSTLETVRNALGAVATALLNLPDSPRRTTIIGIITSIRILLLTVEAFIDSEMAPMVAGALSAPARASMTESINRVFEATEP